LLASGHYGLSGYRLLYSFCKRCTLVILASKQSRFTRVPPLLLLTCFFSLAFLNRHVCIQLIRQLVVAVGLIALIEIRD
jgi:hypothetical protein